MLRLDRGIVALLLAGILSSCAGQPVAVTPSATTPSDVTAPALEPTTIAPTEVSVAPTEASVAPAATAPQSTSTTVAPAQTATEAGTQSDAQLKAELQKTVDIWSQAYNQQEPLLLSKAIDPRALALGRTQRDLVKYFGEAIGSSGRDWSGTVVDTQPLTHGFLLAHVDIGNSRFPFTFKQVKGTWLLSEPARADLGKKQKFETEHFSFEYYPWDEQIAPKVGELMEDAYKIVVGKLGKGPEKKPVVKINPTTELANSKGAVLAFYRRTGNAKSSAQEMVINSPNSFAAGSYPKDTGWEPDLLITLAHEFTHLTNDCCFTPIARQNDWMTEGLAEYISDGPISRQSTVAMAVQQNALIPIQDTSGSNIYKQDLEHLTVLDKDISLAYGEASSLVDYIVQNYGGLDGYWKLIGDYDKTQDFDASLHNVLGISLADFDKGWREELHKRFGG